MFTDFLLLLLLTDNVSKVKHSQAYLMFYFTKEACEHLNHVLTLSYGKCMAVVRTVTFCFTSVIHKITQGAQNVKSEYERADSSRQITCSDMPCRLEH